MSSIIYNDAEDIKIIQKSELITLFLLIYKKFITYNPYIKYKTYTYNTKLNILNCCIHNNGRVLYKIVLQIYFHSIQQIFFKNMFWEVYLDTHTLKVRLHMKIFCTGDINLLRFATYPCCLFIPDWDNLNIIKQNALNKILKIL